MPLELSAGICHNTSTMIFRFIEKEILDKLKPGLVLCLFGARRTGKTVLMDKIRQKLSGKKILLVQGESLETQEVLSSQKIEILHQFTKGFDYLFIDEAQSIPKIGLNLKLLVDTKPDLSVFVTGSASFDLRNKIGEPLVGRSLFLHLFPVAQLELSKTENFMQTKEKLENRLLYGSYPKIIMAEADQEKRALLEALRDGYLLKDILTLDNLKDSLFIFNLLRLLAFQIGKDVSFSELASNLNVHSKTVRRYLELLEKVFVIFSLNGFSRNLRKEYTKSPRYYFWDNGIRNALISNFNHQALRDDVGQLWENYCISERFKKIKYQEIFCNHFFWRTYDQKEIDLLEERDGKLFGYEIKWKSDKTKTPKDFLSAYPGSEYKIINQDNYLEFIA